MNIIALSEERDEETSYGYCNEYQPHAVKRMFDHEVSDGIGMSACDCNIPDTYFRQNDLG